MLLTIQHKSQFVIVFYNYTFFTIYNLLTSTN
jgi:hypothetical protein